MPKASYIQISNLSFSFKKEGKAKTDVLKNISLNIEEGEFIAVVGPSGCGKTTLLNCLDGLLTPTKGNIKINGKIVLSPGSDRAFVFQDSLLLPWRNILGNIGFGAQMQGVGKEEITKKSKGLIKQIHLNGFEKFYPHQLSGGMKQRVNIARALCIDPAILLLDEPFSNLDAQIRQIMQQELLTIYDKNNKTFIFVTHNISEAIYLADRIIVLSKRPGVIKKIIKVNLPRPRSLSIKETVKFIEIKKQVGALIKNEIQI